MFMCHILVQVLLHGCTVLAYLSLFTPLERLEKKDNSHEKEGEERGEGERMRKREREGGRGRERGRKGERSKELATLLAFSRSLLAACSAVCTCCSSDKRQIRREAK